LQAYVRFINFTLNHTIRCANRAAAGGDGGPTKGISFRLFTQSANNFPLVAQTRGRRGFFY